MSGTPAGVTDPLAVLNQHRTHVAMVRRQEREKLAEIAEIDRVRLLLWDRFMYYKPAGLSDAEWIQGCPDHFAALARDLHDQGQVDGCMWPIDPPTGTPPEVFRRAFTTCFLACDAEGMRTVVGCVIEYHSDMNPVVTLWEFLQGWRTTEADAWFVRSPVSAYETAVRALEFAAELDSGDLAHLSTITPDRVVRQLELVGMLAGKNREVHRWWERTVAAVTALAGKTHPYVSERATAWLAETCPRPSAEEEFLRAVESATEDERPDVPDRTSECSAVSGGPNVPESADNREVVAVDPVGEPDADADQRDRPYGHGVALACELKRQHPEWSDAKVAKEAKCSAPNLSQSDKYQSVKEQVENAAKLERARRQRSDRRRKGQG